ncbi:MAG TPA: hypothetical protein EYH36_03935 [Desulfocapsa sulfexigens]|nr:hypothetical protein [Desulfocapsa sulfexigens]
MLSKTIISLVITLFLIIGSSSSLSLAEEPAEAMESVETETPKIKKKTSFNSVEERRLHTVLQNERDNLEEEKKVIALKKKELKTLQDEADKKLELLDEKLAELQKVQAKIEELLAEKDVRELKKTKDLSLIYAKMTPDKAALAMTALDEQLAANLLATMKVKSAAKILDRMDKLKASQLSTTFATIKVE